jgi:DNA repair exonuclease SbcCD nuclease subunit
MYTFIHTSDWHLGKPFGQFEDDLRGRLREARHSVIERIASQARQIEARLIIVAGDIWDSDAPSSAILHQSLDAMGRHNDLTWALMPGNHDLALDGGLWEKITQKRLENIRLLLDERPLEVEQSVFLLPAPCRTKDPGRDLTQWMDAAETPDGALRIGVAHGGVREFGAERPHSSIIDPDRVSRARLDYLALGDWHGAIRMNERCWYSGTPEPTSFKRNDSGKSLAVTINDSGEVPSVEPIPTAQFTWIDQDIDVLPEMIPDEILATCLPEGVEQRDALVNVRLRGRATLADRAQWEQGFADLLPSLAFLAYDIADLEIAYEAEDLDRIDRAGALREAADALKNEATDPELGESDQKAARDALNLLYSWCVGAEEQT